MKVNNGEVIITHVKQAYFYIHNGAECKGVVADREDKKLGFIFDKRATRELFARWILEKPAMTKTCEELS